ncbi:MAG: hypothetical protein WBD27_17675 [Pyrinomonadaceae bacterium]
MNYKRIMKSSIISTLIIAIGILAGTKSLVNAQGDSELNQELAQVRRATAKYHDINVAIADGFVPIDGTCVDTANGTHGIGYVNVPRFISPEVDPLEPEILNYIPTGDGNLRLINVVYTNRVLFRDTRPPGTPGYRLGIFPLQLPVIPPHFEEVSGSFALFGQQPVRLFGGPWIYLLSAWVWSPNPNGMFAGANPRLSCTANN